MIFAKMTEIQNEVYLKKKKKKNVIQINKALNDCTCMLWLVVY